MFASRMILIIGEPQLMKRPMDSITTRLTTGDTPALGDDWERIVTAYGIDGAAFVRAFLNQVVEFEKKHGRPPKLSSLSVLERRPEP